MFSAGNSHAVSSALGTVMLIGVVVIGIGIVSVTIFSQPPPEELPVADLVATIVDNKTLYIAHNGGDPLSEEDFILTANGEMVSAEDLTISGGDGDWPFEVGETITYHSTTPLDPDDVNIDYGNYAGSVTYTEAGGSDLIPPEEMVPTGDLRVETEPTGATIYIDGRERGISDMTFTGITAGIHTVIVELDGYQSSGALVTVEEGDMAVVHLVLVPLEEEHHPGEPEEVYFVCEHMTDGSLNGNLTFTSADGDVYRIAAGSAHLIVPVDIVINGSMVSSLSTVWPSWIDYDLYINGEWIPWWEWDNYIPVEIDPASVNSDLKLVVEPGGSILGGTTLIFDKKTILSGFDSGGYTIELYNILPGTVTDDRLLNIHNGGWSVAVLGQARVKVNGAWL